MTEENNENEKAIEITPKELEFAFAQAARFGAFIYFLFEEKNLCQHIFKKYSDDKNDFDPDDPMSNLSKIKKKKALMEVAHFFLAGTPDGKKVGSRVEKHFSELYFDEMVWDHIETFNELCNMSKIRKSK